MKIIEEALYRIHEEYATEKLIFIGAESEVLPYAKIDSNVIIGAYSTITKDIPHV